MIQLITKNSQIIIAVQKMLPETKNGDESPIDALSNFDKHVE